MFWYAYLIIGLIILTYLFYRTITNIIRRSKGLPIKKYGRIYSFIYDDALINTTTEDDIGIFWASTLVSILWPIHWGIYIGGICYTKLFIPLLTLLTLSKEEKVQIALGAVSPPKEK